MRYEAPLALLVREPPSGAQWIHERKLDGYRIGPLVERGKVRLVSRRGKDWTSEFPGLAGAAKKLQVRSAVVDGEVVMLFPGGLSSFEALENRARPRESLAYFAFDLLWLDGRDLARRPLIERKAHLREVLGKAPDMIRYTDHFEDPGAKVLRQACAPCPRIAAHLLRDSR